MQLTECRPGDRARMFTGASGQRPRESLHCELGLTRWVGPQGRQLCFCGKKRKFSFFAPAQLTGWGGR